MAQNHVFQQGQYLQAQRKRSKNSRRSIIGNVRTATRPFGGVPVIYCTDLAQLALVSPRAAAFVQEHDLATVSCGRHELGEGDYVNVMEYTTRHRCDCCYEAHRDYIDIQMVLQGTETLEVAPKDALELTSPYDSEGDCSLYNGSYQGERFCMTPGRWCLVMPQDAHMPGASPTDEPAPVKKAVFKIRVENLA